MKRLLCNPACLGALLFAYGALVHVGLVRFFLAYSSPSEADRVALQRVPVALLISALGGFSFALLAGKFLLKSPAHFWYRLLVGGGIGMAATFFVIEVVFAVPLLSAMAYASFPDLIKQLIKQPSALVQLIEIFLLEFATLQLGFISSISRLMSLAFCYGALAAVIAHWLGNRRKLVSVL